MLDSPEWKTTDKHITGNRGQRGVCGYFTQSLTGNLHSKRIREHEDAWSVKHKISWNLWLLFDIMHDKNWFIYWARFGLRPAVRTSSSSDRSKAVKTSTKVAKERCSCDGKGSRLKYLKLHCKSLQHFCIIDTFCNKKNPQHRLSCHWFETQQSNPCFAR